MRCCHVAQAVKSVSAERAGLQANADAHREALKAMASRLPELEAEKKAVVCVRACVCLFACACIRALTRAVGQVAARKFKDAARISKELVDLQTEQKELEALLDKVRGAVGRAERPGGGGAIAPGAGDCRHMNVT